MQRGTTVLLVSFMLTLAVLFPLLPVEAGDHGPPGSRYTHYSTDFESGAGNWTHGGASDEWELGDPSDGPGYCHSGSNCWATDLDDVYEAEANAYLESPSIDLTNATTADLEFYHWYDISNFMGLFADRGYVEISDDGGSEYESPVNFTGSNPEEDWHKVTVDLDEYVGHEVIVRFRLSSDEIFEESGWFIDDVSVKVNEGSSPDIHDLGVTDVTVEPGTPKVDKKAQITVHVVNAGTNSEDAFNITVTITDPDTGAPVHTGTRAGTSMGPGGSLETTFPWTPEQAKTYVLEARVDLATDENKGNDSITVRVRVETSPHDLAVTDIYVVPASPSKDKRTTVVGVITNQGQFEESDIRVKFSLTHDGVVEKRSNTTIDLLGLNENVTVEFVFTPGKVGFYLAEIQVVLEKDADQEDNRAEVTVSVPSDGPDIGVVNVTVAPEDAGPGEVRTITAVVANQGDETIADAKVSCTVSNATGVVEAFSSAVDDLGVGSTVSLQWSLTPDREGTYTVTVRADLEGDVNHGNDVGTTVFRVPDLLRDVGIGSLTVSPRTAGLDTKRIIRVTLENSGETTEAFRSTLEVVDPNGTVARSMEYSRKLEAGQEVVLESEYRPQVHGNHTVEAETILEDDDVPSNDRSTTFFIVTRHRIRDVGVESLAVSPRTAGLEERTLSFSVKNLGTDPEEGVSAILTVHNSSGGEVLSSTNTLSLQPGETGGLDVSFTPSSYDTYTARITVTLPGDEVPENDEGSLIFWAVAPPALDLGIGSVNVTPRTADLEERTVSTWISNNGQTDAGPASLSVRIDWDGGNMTCDPMDIPVLDPGNGTLLEISFVPEEYGEHVVTVNITNHTDDFPENDNLTRTFFAVEHVHTDMGLEVLRVEPRTGYTDEIRTITLIMANFGDGKAEALATIVVRDGDGGMVHGQNVTRSVDPATQESVQVQYTPTGAGEYGVFATVHIVDVAEDDEPGNDHMNTSLVVLERPPEIDVAVESLLVAPSSPVTGSGLRLVARLANRGMEAVEGVLEMVLVDPQGSRTDWDRTISLERNGIKEEHFDLTPLVSGTFNVTATVRVAGDSVPGNDVGSMSFEVTAGGLDVAVRAMKVDMRGMCGPDFDVIAELENLAPVPVEDVHVEMDVYVNGEIEVQDAVDIDLAANGTEQVVFDLTITGEFRVVVTAILLGDEDMSNNNLTERGRSCDPADLDTSTSVDSGMLPFLLALLLVMIAIVGVFLYEARRPGSPEAGAGKDDRVGGGGKDKARPPHRHRPRSGRRSPYRDPPTRRPGTGRTPREVMRRSRP